MYKDKLLEVIDDKISELQVGIIQARKKIIEEIEKEINDFDTSFNRTYDFKIIFKKV